MEINLKSKKLWLVACGLWLVGEGILEEKNRKYMEQYNNQYSESGKALNEQGFWNKLYGPALREKYCSNIFKAIWHWEYCFGD